MKTIINIKADRDIKIKAQKVAKQLGVPLSLVINNYLRDFVRTKEVHFSLRDSLPLGKPEGVLKPAVARRLARIHKDIVEGKNLVGPFNSAKEAISYLRS
ncbi:MAG: hypothetical protein EXS51_00205 [Candidatus Taylorbacteria bacterium]|nr:hypothetical protein [Candidatus Taylorbacteria bacterium]